MRTLHASDLKPLLVIDTRLVGSRRAYLVSYRLAYVFVILLFGNMTFLPCQNVEVHIALPTTELFKSG